MYIKNKLFMFEAICTALSVRSSVLYNSKLADPLEHLFEASSETGKIYFMKRKGTEQLQSETD